MPQKYYVGISLYGKSQYYQRDAENLVKGRWTAVPTFTPELPQAILMSEELALSLVKRLRDLKEDPWLQTPEGQRIKPPEDGQPQHIEDTRKEVRATLDDEHSAAAQWYVVRPANTVNGPKWFVKYSLPGRPVGQDSVFSDSALEALERAKMIGVLEFCEKDVPAPQAPQPAVAKVRGPMIRPGDRGRV
jgi:hypothetical protein